MAVLVKECLLHGQESVPSLLMTLQNKTSLISLPDTSNLELVFGKNLTSVSLYCMVKRETPVDT